MNPQKTWRIRCSALIDAANPASLGYLYWNGVAWTALSRTAALFASEGAMQKILATLSPPRTARGTMKGYAL